MNSSQILLKFAKLLYTVCVVAIKYTALAFFAYPLYHLPGPFDTLSAFDLK